MIVSMISIIGLIAMIHEMETAELNSFLIEMSTRVWLNVGQLKSCLDVKPLSPIEISMESESATKNGSRQRN